MLTAERNCVWDQVTQAFSTACNDSRVATFGTPLRVAFGRNVCTGCSGEVHLESALRVTARLGDERAGKLEAGLLAVGALGLELRRNELGQEAQILLARETPVRRVGRR